MKFFKPTTSLSLFIPLSILGALAMDIYIPAIPSMVDVFETTPAVMQWTLSIFMLSTAAGQLLLGPLADRFGRKLIAVLSTCFYIFASIGCAFSESVEQLVFFRFVQGLGACGASVACAAMVRDLYNGNQSAKLYSQINGAVGLAPIIAPIVGGYILFNFDAWQWLFIVLAFFGFIPFILSIKHPETLSSTSINSISAEHHLKTDLRSLTQIVKRFIYILHNKQFFCYMLAVLTGMTGLFTFFSASAEILITHLAVPAQSFGYYFGLCAIAYTIGSFSSPTCQVQIGRSQTVLFGNASIVFGATLMSIWYLYSGISIVALILPMMFISFGIGLMMGCAYSLAMEPFGEMAGTAAALLGCLQFLGATILGHHAMQYDTSSPLPLSLTMLPLGLVCIAVVLMHQKRQALST